MNIDTSDLKEIDVQEEPMFQLDSKHTELLRNGALIDGLPLFEADKVSNLFSDSERFDLLPAVIKWGDRNWHHYPVIDVGQRQFYKVIVENSICPSCGWNGTALAPSRDYYFTFGAQKTERKEACCSVENC